MKQLAAPLELSAAMAVAEEAALAHAHEASGQHVQEQAADEFSWAPSFMVFHEEASV